MLDYNWTEGLITKVKYNSPKYTLYNIPFLKAYAINAAVFGTLFPCGLVL